MTANKDYEERAPLLRQDDESFGTEISEGSASDGIALSRNADEQGETYDNVPKAKRQLGLFSAAFLIFNRVIGTGIYATPSTILRSSGSVGVSFIMWLFGAFVATCGTLVYIEFGTGLPRNGGEKNYLEFVYRHPRFLSSCGFMVYTFIMGAAAANSVVFAEYTLHAFSVPPDYFYTRFIAFLCITFIVLLHGTFLTLGVRLQNALGIFKLVVLALISLTGILSLTGIGGLKVREGYEKPNNFTWETFWEGSSGKGVNAFVSGVYNVIWSFTGYSNANYALSEIRNPVRTIKRAAPLAVSSVIAVYLFTNVAYFSVVSKNDILESRRIVAALYFRNLFGPTTERALSFVIALSTLGNLLGSQFSQGRVIQELGREGILPYSSFFASNKPFNAPFAGLFFQYFISCTFLLAIPPGDAYLFMISLSSYSLTLINTMVSLGLMLLYTPAYKSRGWNPPFAAPKALIVLFFLSNIFLLIVPFFPPVGGDKVYERLAYWAHPVGSLSVSLFGIGYWYVWSIWLPKKKGYALEREWMVQEDGVSRFAFKRVARSVSSNDGV